MTDQIRNSNIPTTETSSPATNTEVNAAPILCVKGCGFWGNTKTRSMCSKCFRDIEKQLEKENAVFPSLSPTPSPMLTPSTPTDNIVLTPLTSSLPIPSPTSVPIPATPCPSPCDVPISISTPTISPSPAPISSPSLSPSPAPLAPSSDSKKKLRCQSCAKKLTSMSYFTCRCDESFYFCATHRYPHAHQCGHDHKAQHQAKLTTANPLVKPTILEKI